MMRACAVVVVGMVLGVGCQPSCQPAASTCVTDADCPFVQECRDATCQDGALAAALPPLPPSGGPGGARAFYVDDVSGMREGNAAQARPGDLVIQNNHARFVIQKPGREIAVAPFGGNVIDAVALVDGQPLPDEFGELQPVLNLGSTVNFTRLDVVRDGSDGGSVVVRAYGRPALWEYVNLGGFMGDLLATSVPFDPDQNLVMKVVATYELPADKPFLRITWTMVNQDTVGFQLPVGIAVDSGGEVLPFRAGPGFGSTAYNVDAVLSGDNAVPWFGFSGKQVSTAIRPRSVLGDASATSTNPTVQVAGVTVSLFSKPDVLSALESADLFLEAGHAWSYGVDLAVSGSSLAAASAILMQEQGLATRSFRVRVVDEETSAPIRDALVLIRGQHTDPDSRPTVASGRTDELGVARFQVPPGAVDVQVRAEGREPAEDLRLTEDKDEALITMLTAGNLSYRFRVARRMDRPTTEAAPCRITVVGADQEPDDAARRAVFDRPPYGVAALRYSETCDSASDGALKLAPGRYLVIASAGPAYDIWQGLVDVGTTTASVEGTLHRVVDDGPYLATDWHQHSVNSPDSPIPLRDRLRSYLGEGIELFGGSDHDVVTDWERIVAELGFSDRIVAINGVECTPFDYGHFNIFPLSPNQNMVNGGALDWAGGDGPNLAPPQLFQAYRQMGAQVVQVNHPRQVTGFGFQTYFDRAALTFDPVSGVAFGDVEKQPLPNEMLRIPAQEPMWTAEFDAVEIYNGFRPYDGTLPTRPAGDRKADRIMLDVGNLILVGHRPIMTGTSDTHGLAADQNGYPRTYVRASRGADGRVDPWDVLNALAGTGNAPNRGDVIVSNGPMPIITASYGATRVSPGGLVVAPQRVTVEIDVVTPRWMPLASADVLVSPHYVEDPGEMATPPAPALSAPLGEPVVETLQNGGERLRYHATLDVDVAQHNPFAGKDAFLVVRVHGAQPVWPVLTAGLALQIDENGQTPEEFLQVRNGIAALAMANPIYVDVDGDGRFTGAWEH
ncbi:MAG: CehA/McbA family metallohydrolase [Myxococcota bacterium]